MPWIAFLSFLLHSFILWGTSQAIHLQVRGRNEVSASLGRQLVSRGIGGLTLNNSADISYFAEILLGNQTFQVLIDTGSSDLWVAGNVSNSKDTGFNASIQYAANFVEGPIRETRLTFGGHVIDDQAFLQIVPNDSNEAGSGILGLGPSSGSFVAEKLGKKDAVTVLDRIFTENISVATYFTVLLGRSNDPTDFFSGSITVGELLQEYADIQHVVKLNITRVPESLANEQHHQILLDADGIIGPDGKAITVITEVAQTENKKQATVVLDCGFTLPQVPRDVADAIYGKFYGSEFVEIEGLGGVWILPCEQEVNVTFSFSGTQYPIHPLDMSIPPATINLPDIKTMDGEVACIGTFQPFTYDKGKIPIYDIVLGMAFMRNVYSLFDYGDYAPNSTEDRRSRYVQMLPTTERAEAHADFVTVRLGGNDTTATKGLRKDSSGNSGRTSMYYIIAVVAAVALLIAGVVFFILRRRRRRRR